MNLMAVHSRIWRICCSHEAVRDATSLMTCCAMPVLRHSTANCPNHWKRLRCRWFACGWYRGAARQSILAWKDHGDEECDRPFSDALCRLAERAGVIDAMDGVREICDTILVVPASSSIASMRQRGRRHMMPLAKRLSAFLRCRTGFRVQVCDALTNKGIKGKSVETKARNRGRNALRGMSWFVRASPFKTRR